ncbi:MAG TPA: SMP-30/gluconolactonase/LRE family protein [Chloroflexota bacterium]|nr:SMP-30/gluconolactonase/LRE family protein [Chloroflexota bacterium]
MRHRLAVALISLLALLASNLPGANSLAASSPLAKIRWIGHGIAVQPPGAHSRNGTVKMPLFNRYGLSTSPIERASIGFSDGTVLHINTNTDIILVNPHQTQLRRGEVAEYLAPGTHHAVSSDAAVAAALGTTFDVRVSGTTSTFIVLSGALQVANSAGAVVVKSNHETTVIPGKAPTPPVGVNALAVFAWTDGIPTPQLDHDIALDADGGHIIAFSSQQPAEQWHAAHAIDGLLSQGWETAGGQVTNQWIKVGFVGDNFYRISQVIIDPAATHGDPASADLQNFMIRISSTGTDDASFTTIYRGHCAHIDTLQVFKLPVPVRARYVELVAIDNYGNPNRLAVAEFEVYASTSLFASPHAVATDRRGNIYVADETSNRVQVLSPAGKLLHQWGQKGHNPGQLNRPDGIAVDRQGNVYVADTLNHRVQKYSPSGRLLAHWGSFGSRIGQFYDPEGVAVDATGNIYVADLAGIVQKLTPRGKASLFWEDPAIDLLKGIAAGIEGITLDSRGDVFLTEALSDRIVEIGPDGHLLGTRGTQGSDPGQFSYPTGIAVDGAGNVYVADTFNNRIQKIDPSGRATVWGSFGASRGQFESPTGVATDRRGNVYVADNYNSRVQKLSTNGKVRAVWGKYATIPQVLGQPAGIAVDTHGDIYVTDDVNDRVQQRNPRGHVTAVVGYHGFLAGESGGGPGLGQFYYPHGIKVDARGAIYVVDTFNNRIQVLSPRGPVGAVGSLGTHPGQFYWPEGIALDPRNPTVFYVADTFNNRIQKFSLVSNVVQATLQFGSQGQGPGQFLLPGGIAADAFGNVYVADTYNNRIQKFDSQGKLLDVWGTPGQLASGEFFSPSDVAVDNQGNVYVADSGHGVIEELSPSGQTIQTFRNLPGPGPFPSCVAVDKQGNVYYGDSLNNWIVKLAPDGKVLALWN